jgi:hypothetical protein
MFRKNNDKKFVIKIKNKTLVLSFISRHFFRFQLNNHIFWFTNFYHFKWKLFEFLFFILISLERVAFWQDFFDFYKLRGFVWNCWEMMEFSNVDGSNPAKKIHQVLRSLFFRMENFYFPVFKSVFGTARIPRISIAVQ